jgi:biopolymer transport protein ExbB/TolQ
VPGAEMLGNVGLVTAALTFIGSVAVARIQSRAGASTRAEQRIAALEAQVDKQAAELAAAREKHMEAYERLMQEEEDLRDKHAGVVTGLRERVDDLRVQLMAMRAELMRRGINPDRLLGEPVAA